MALRGSPTTLWAKKAILINYTTLRLFAKRVIINKATVGILRYPSFPNHFNLFRLKRFIPISGKKRFRDPQKALNTLLTSTNTWFMTFLKDSFQLQSFPPSKKKTG